jgi:hypothetical protein
VRCLIDKVVVHRQPSDAAQVRVVWKGGDTTNAQVPLPVHALSRLSRNHAMQEKLLKLSATGQNDQAVARQLTAAGFRSPSQTVVLPSTVREIRLRHHVLLKPGHSNCPRGYLTVTQLARKLGILSHWIYDRIHRGIIEVSKDPAAKLYLFPDRPKTLVQFRQLLAGKLRSLRI